MKILIEQEIALHQYDTRQNKAEIERLLHPDFKEVGESGTRYDYQSIIAMMAAEQRSDGYVHSQGFQCIALAPSVRRSDFLSLPLKASSPYTGALQTKPPKNL